MALKQRQNQVCALDFADILGSIGYLVLYASGDDGDRLFVFQRPNRPQDELAPLCILEIDEEGNISADDIEASLNWKLR
ncbi:MAG: hypothetical protein JRD89_00175 [Deltaproteobacteria bacterium]|nr:hypothetical protein [Deltaproteobacteria bacterium]